MGGGGKGGGGGPAPVYQPPPPVDNSKYFEQMMEIQQQTNQKMMDMFSQMMQAFKEEAKSPAPSAVAAPAPGQSTAAVKPPVDIRPEKSVEKVKEDVAKAVKPAKPPIVSKPILDEEEPETSKSLLTS